MNASENGAATITCPKCQAANSAVARFCFTCGSPMQPGIAAAPQQQAMQPAPSPAAPPLPPPMPMSDPVAFAQRFAPSGYLNNAGGPSSTVVALDVKAAYAAAVQAIQSASGTIKAQQPPSMLRFEMSKRNFWQTGWIRVVYDGDLALSAMGPRQTAARVGLKMNSSSSMTLIATTVIGALISLLLTGYALGWFMPLFVAVCGGFQYWNLSSRVPREMAEGVINSLMQGAPLAPSAMVPTPQAPAPQASTPTRAAPIPAAPSPAPEPAPASNGASSNIVEQLKQLVELRNLGAVTPEEYEAKRVELLKRL